MAYAYMVEHTEDRAALDAELYAPLGGTEAATARLWEQIGARIEGEGDR